MQAIGRQPQQAPDGAPLHHQRHRPEPSTLYRLVQRHAASVIAHVEAKIPRTRRWRVTDYGRKVMGTTMYLREHPFLNVYAAVMH